MQIEINDPAGVRHCITSSNPETIGRWIMETFAEMAATRWDLRKYPPRVMVYPTWNPDTREGDWVLDTTILTRGMEPSSPRQFLDMLYLQVEEWEEKQARP